MNSGEERFLIIGSGGRESAFASRLTAEPRVSLYAVCDHENPTIVDCVNASGGQYLIADTTQAHAISQFARQHKIDYAFVNADAPLANGVVDELLDNEIKTVGATRTAARIEWDKVYAMELMQRVCPEFTPFYKIVSKPQELHSAVDTFKKRKLLVVVKPQGLTGGKGVKVMRQHLKSYQDSADYAASLLKQSEGAKVLLVEKLNGIEFTVMGFTDGEHLVLSPASYDYPFRKINDKGPGTGGMGCFTSTLKKLPFMNDKDLRDCRTIMTRVMRAMKADNARFSGVLNGGFFKTRDGLRFMEFNARFGDPEALNILMVLKTPFSRVIKDMWYKRLAGERVQFIKKASVIKYLVAAEYPYASAMATRFAVNEEALRTLGIQIYYASCLREKKERNTYITLKKSRVVAFGKTSQSIAGAATAINEAIAKHVVGTLDYRKDIGLCSDLQKLAHKSEAL